MSFIFGRKNKKCIIEKNDDYYVDDNDDIDIVYKNSKLLTTRKSDFQTIKVYQNLFFGKILVIDDDIQLTEHDEKKLSRDASPCAFIVYI